MQLYALLPSSPSRQIPSTPLPLPQIEFNPLAIPRLTSFSRPQPQPSHHTFSSTSSEISNPFPSLSNDELRRGTIEYLLKGVGWSWSDGRVVDVGARARARLGRMEWMGGVRGMRFVNGGGEGGERNERMTGGMKMDRYRS